MNKRDQRLAEKVFAAIGKMSEETQSIFHSALGLGLDLLEALPDSPTQHVIVRINPETQNIESAPVGGVYEQVLP